MILSAALVVICLSLPAFAASATVKITANPASVYANDQVQIKISITGSERIGSWNFSLQYDPAYLEYVSGADGGGGGALLFADSTANPSGEASVEHTVTFKTKKIGSTSVSIRSPQIVGMETLKNLNASDASGNVEIKARPTLSGDNNLSSLSLSHGTLSPAFSQGTTEYSAEVPYEVTSLSVSATASHGAARVAVSSGSLYVGENTITITVTAENGNKKYYTVKVTRRQSELAGVTVQIGEETFTFEHEPSVLAVPEGFRETIISFGDQKVLAFVSPKDSITVCYLKGETRSDWFVYEEEKNTFFPMETAPGEKGSLVILPIPENTTIPFGYSPCTVNVKKLVVQAYYTELSAEKNVYLIYGMIPDGTLGFFFYDLQNQSMISYFEGTVIQSDPIIEKDPTVDAELKSRLEAAERSAYKMEILALILGLVVVFLGIVAVLLLIFRRKPKKQKKVPIDELAPLLQDGEEKVPVDLDAVYGEKKKK